MSRKLIDAIASGDNLEAESEFKSSISSKVGNTLEIVRKELSQNYVSNNESVIEEEGKPYIKQKPDGTWCVYDSEGNIVSEHESEDDAKEALSSMSEDSLASMLRPGGSLSKEKDTGKGWQNINKVLAKKDDGKGMQPISKMMAKKPVKKVTKPDVPPVAIVPSTSRPEKPKKDTRRSPGALGGRRRGRSPGAMGGKSDEYGGL